jgi:hypothetical protein
MIRRWSHLNFVACISTRALAKLRKKSKLNLFKVNVKFKHFKKFKIKFTKIRRRAFRRLKRRSSLVPLRNVFKFWTLDYRIIRNLAKFEYFHNLFSFNYLIYNYNYLKNNNENVSYNVDFYISSFNSILARATSPITCSALTDLKLVSFFGGTPASFSWFNEPVDPESPLYVPLASSFDSTFSTPLDYSNVDEYDIAEIFLFGNGLNERQLANFYSFFICLAWTLCY